MGGEPIARLIIKGSDLTDRVATVHDGESVKVGRSAENHIVLNDAGASRFHAIFTASTNGVVLMDNASMNGTFLNGEQLLSLRDLSNGDVVDIGGTKIIVELFNEPEQTKDNSRAMTAKLTPVAVTVLVASVQHFKKLSRSLPPSQIDKKLAEWRDQVHGLVAKHEGVIDKDCGHTVVALWTQHEAEEDAVRAVRTALELRRLNTTAAPLSRTSCVLSSGAGLSGVVGDGSGGQKGFTVLGEPINLAFKVQSMVGKLGADIIVPEMTADLLQDDYVLEKLIRVKPDGVGDGIDIFTVV